MDKDLFKSNNVQFNIEHVITDLCSMLLTTAFTANYINPIRGYYRSDSSDDFHGYHMEAAVISPMSVFQQQNINPVAGTHFCRYLGPTDEESYSV